MEGREEDYNHVEKFKQEIVHYKHNLEAANKERARLEILLMQATNRADEAALRKQYEDGDITSLVETYRQKSNEATLAKEQAGEKIQHLVTDLENSVFLEKENNQLSLLLSNLNQHNKQVSTKLETSETLNQTLAIENIKYQKLYEGQLSYYEEIGKNQSVREIDLVHREQLWKQKEQELENIIENKYASKMKELELKHRHSIGTLKQVRTNSGLKSQYIRPHCKTGVHYW